MTMPYLCDDTMEMNVHFKRNLNRRARPYIFEAIYSLAIDMILVVLMLFVFQHVEILKNGIMVSGVYLLSAFILNHRIAFLRAIDLICHMSKGSMVCGTLLT